MSFFNITFSISVYIMCVCLFTTLSHRVGGLQISIIINTNCHLFLFLLTPIIIVPIESDVIPAHTTGCYSWQLGWLYMTTLSYRLRRIHPNHHQGNPSSTIALHDNFVIQITQNPPKEPSRQPKQHNSFTWQLCHTDYAESTQTTIKATH